MQIIMMVIFVSASTLFYSGACGILIFGLETFIFLFIFSLYLSFHVWILQFQISHLFYFLFRFDSYFFDYCYFI